MNSVALPNLSTLPVTEGSLRDRSGHLIDNWYAAGLSKSLRKQAKSVVVMETRLVLWRNSEGKIIALRDRCSHRNAKLSEGTISVDRDCISCPYHGWQFSAKGELVRVPTEGEDGKAFQQRMVEYFPVLEQEGLIWVWMGKDKHPDKAPFPMPYYGVKNWGTYYMVTDFDNNVTNLVENFMDVPHTVYVHKGWFRDRKKKHVKASVERTTNSVLVTYDQKNDEIGFTDRILNPKRLPLHHTDKFYMPNNTRVDYIWGAEQRGFVITSTCTPISEYKTRVYTCISYKLGLLNVTAPLWLPWYTRQVIGQDVEIMANQGANLQEESPKFNNTPVDIPHVFIETLRDSAMARKDPPEPRKKDFSFWI